VVVLEEEDVSVLAVLEEVGFGLVAGPIKMGPVLKDSGRYFEPCSS